MHPGHPKIHALGCCRFALVFSGLVGELDLFYTLLGSTRFGWAVSLARPHLLVLGVQPFFVDGVGASIRHALGRRFDILGSADRHVYNYRNFLNVEIALLRPGRRPELCGQRGHRHRPRRPIGFGASYIQRVNRRTKIARITTCAWQYVRVRIIAMHCVESVAAISAASGRAVHHRIASKLASAAAVFVVLVGFVQSAAAQSAGDT